MVQVESEFKALIKAWLEVLISLTYTYFIVSKFPRGKIRFFGLLPIFILFILVPLSLSAPIAAGLMGLFISWVANFKLILFAFNHGPLSQQLPMNSLLAFILIGAFPIRIKQNGSCHQFAQTNNNVYQNIPLGLLPRILMYSLTVVAGIYCTYNKYVHPNIIFFIYPFMMYIFLETVLGLCKKFVGFILDKELSPQFDEPFLSTSLQAFWGRRWNLAVSDVLRHTIYVPVRAICEVHTRGRWAQYLAITTTFVVSGLMHELIMYYVTRTSPTWEQTRFLFFHGVSVVAEIVLKRAFGMRKLHWALSGPLTIGFLMNTGYWLFIPQLVRIQGFSYF